MREEINPEREKFHEREAAAQKKGRKTETPKEKTLLIMTALKWTLWRTVHSKGSKFGVRLSNINPPGNEPSGALKTNDLRLRESVKDQL